MEDVAAMITDAIASRMKAAQAEGLERLRARAQYGDEQAIRLLARANAAGVKGKAASPAPSSRQPVAPNTAAPSGAPAELPAVPVAALPPPAPSLEPAELSQLPASILGTAEVERPMLLGAFSGAGLLPAIVLAEALATPVALREDARTR